MGSVSSENLTFSKIPTEDSQCKSEKFYFLL